MDSITHSYEQLEAISLCNDVSKRIVCVTGQAGTGKTTILRDTYNALSEYYYGGDETSEIPSTTANPNLIMLAAPTGRAAKRIEEATGIKAMTIHRMLRFGMPEDEDDITLPKHDKANPLPYKCILIDEASMIDNFLWRSLIDAMRPRSIIRFFGDINQLPPINNSKTNAIAREKGERLPASPFADAIKKFSTVTLTHNYRSEDGIISASDRIIKGKMPLINEQTRIIKISGNTMFANIDQLTKTSESIDFTSLSSQIITPTQATMYGCNSINSFIQSRYNPEVKSIQTFQKDFSGKLISRTFKRGDKIIFTKNDYNLNIMNGTIGIIQSFDTETGSIVCTFEDSDIEIPSQITSYNPHTGETFNYDPRNSLMLAYAITTHKSQGSQFDNVLYVLSSSRAATRQNLYTAVTRAKYKLIIFNIANALLHTIQKKEQI